MYAIERNIRLHFCYSVASISIHVRTFTLVLNKPHQKLKSEAMRAADEMADR